MALKEYRKASGKAPGLSEPYALLAVAAETKRNFNESAHAHLDAHERSAFAAALRALRPQRAATEEAENSEAQQSPSESLSDSFRLHADAALALAKSSIASADQPAASAVIERVIDHSRGLLQFLLFPPEGVATNGGDGSGGGAAEEAAAAEAVAEVAAAAHEVLCDARATLGALRRASATAYSRRAEQIKAQVEQQVAAQRHFMARKANATAANGDDASDGEEGGEGADEEEAKMAEAVAANPQYAEAKAKADAFAAQAHASLRRCVAPEIVSNPAAPPSGSRVEESLSPKNQSVSRCLDMRAKMCYERGEHEQAVRLWRSSAAFDPADPYALANLGVALREVRKQPSRQAGRQAGSEGTMKGEERAFP